MYFRIMRASSGGVGIGYLERQPFARIAWMSRLAEASLLQEHLSNIYAVNTGYAGEQKSLDRLQHRIDFLTLVEPKTDVKKLQKYKDIQKSKAKEARAKKRKEKKRKWVKLDMKDK